MRSFSDSYYSYRSAGNSMIKPFEEDSTTGLVLKAPVRKLDLQIYDGFWSTLDIMNKARYVP